ncbi:hypothetical protein C8R46DRAFT_1124225 [Mycena filopes]|nr:hypothetical protein C8R46DRAFT_1124225 [Mycena filopes]
MLLIPWSLSHGEFTATAKRPASADRPSGTTYNCEPPLMNDVSVHPDCAGASRKPAPAMLTSTPRRMRLLVYIFTDYISLFLLPLICPRWPPRLTTSSLVPLKFMSLSLQHLTQQVSFLIIIVSPSSLRFICYLF